MRLAKKVGVVLAAGMLGFCSAAAWAQAWPSKTIRVVVTLAPGSATDVLARAVAERISGPLGQSVIVENRTGASTTIGAGVVAKADPDGYTVLVNSSAHTVAPFVMSNLPYDTARDLTGVTSIANLPTLLVVPASKGYRSVQDLVAAARAKPGSINYASAAASTQLNAERFRRSAKFEAVHVPFKGAPEALTELIAGRVDFYFSPIGPALTHVREGRLVALAAGSAKRATLLPDLPTTIEAGFPDSDYAFWVGMFAPAKTPRDIVNRLHKEVAAALQAPEIRDRFLKLGAEPMAMEPAAFDAFVRDELRTNAVLVKEVGLKSN